MTAAKTLGRYELICEVAKGQLGPLWAAHATGTDDAPAVLIRRVSTAAPTTPDEVDALFEGAWWMLEVQDPSIARGIDVVKTEGELGVVTEYAEGEVLRSVLRLASFKRKPVPVNVGLRIALDVLEALEQANVQSAPLSNGSTSFVAGGLVPDSVLVGRDGRSRLLDVGVLGPASRVSPIARHPEMASYAAPEQLDDPTKSDMRTNVYAVGVMVWEMLAGKRLFVGSTHQAVSEKVKAGDIARLDSQKPVGGDVITSEVADAIAKAVSTDPAERYASAKEMQDALSAAASVASHADVAALLEDLAGNTLASRRKLVEKALQAKPTAAAKPAAPTPAAAPSPAAKPAPPPRKATLVGIQPPAEAAAFIAGLPKPDPSKVEPPPRPPLESLDSEELESISRVEVIPFGTEEAPTKPAAKETQALAETVKADGASPKPPAAEPIKTQLFGTPAPDAATAIKAAEDETVTRVASPFDSVASLGGKTSSPKPPDVKAPGEVEEVPISIDLTPEPPFRPGSKPEIKKTDEKKAELEAPPLSVKPVPVVAAGVAKPEIVPKPEVGSKPDAAAKPAPSEPEASKPEGEPKHEAKDAEKKKDESAVAWVGPPPGVALDSEADRGSQGEIEEPLPSIVPERTQKLRKFVALGIGGLVGLIALGIAISRIGKKDESAEVPSSTPAVSAKPPPSEEPKKEEPKAEEPKAEEPKKEEPKAEEPKKEEPKAEEPAPKPTTTKPAVTKPAVTKPTTTTTTKPTTTKPKTTKPKPKYTPSGI